MAARSKPETGKPTPGKPDPKKPGPKTGTKKPKPEPDRASQTTNLPTKGHPRKFRTEQDYQDAFLHYIDICQTRGDMPNIAGFCVYCDMHRDTFYAQRDLYPDTHKKIQSALEDRAINYKGNPAMSIFYLKNKFGYSDKGSDGEDNSALLDVDFDANLEETDKYLSKLGYFALPDPDS